MDKIKYAIKFAAAATGANVPVHFIERPESVNPSTGGQFRFRKNGELDIFIYEKDNVDKIIEILLHEFCHAKQVLDGRLRLISDKLMFWKGQRVTQDYLNQPHEVEARQFAREKQIEFNRFWREFCNS